ncbi:MAG: C4-dicarboxylate transporter DctA [Acidobacteria bacterium]|nr:MAG: C4-dicarboxylate transporter DctA [Acidobacteriota bacterium]
MSTSAAIAQPSAAARQPWYAQLWVHVMAGMAAGVLLGIFAPQVGERLQPLGDAFIKAVRMLIAPIVFCTVVVGIAKMGDMARVGRVALKTLIYFEVMTSIALVLGLVIVNIWRPGAGMHLDARALDTSAAFAEGNVLQVLFVAVLFGAALSRLGERGRPLIGVLDAVCAALFRVVGVVMWAAPLGAFGAIAFTVARFGTDTLLSLGELLLSFYVTCLVFVFCVLSVVAWLCGFSLLALMRWIREELLIVFATTSSETVLPRMMTRLEQLGCRRDVVGLVIPTGYSFNLDGTCLYLATTTVFLAQATDTPFTVAQQLGLLAVLLLTSKGSAGVAGAAFVVLAATLSAAGHIPVASVAIVLGIHRLMSEAMTPTNLIGNAVATVAIARWEHALDERELQRHLGKR